MTAPAKTAPIMLGDFAVPVFDDVHTAFGADCQKYPPMEIIPEEHRRDQSTGCRVASALFFSGGKLADHGLQLRPEIDQRAFYTALRAYLCSFAPQHEHKVATCGWLIAECTVAA